MMPAANTGEIKLTRWILNDRDPDSSMAGADHGHVKELKIIYPPVSAVA